MKLCLQLIISFLKSMKFDPVIFCLMGYLHHNINEKKNGVISRVA